MEQILRIISWTVVLGAVIALAYAGFKPVLRDFGFPPVDETQVGGATLAPREEAPLSSAEVVAAAKEACASDQSDEQVCPDP